MSGEDNKTKTTNDSEDYEFTPSDDIMDLKAKDLLVELVGYVEDTEGLVERNTGSVLSFIVNNNDGKNMKIVAWGKVGEKLHPRIEKNAVVHINGAVVKVSNPQYNLTSRRDIQLNIYSNTEVRILGHFTPPEQKIPTISISDPGIITHTKCRVTGFIKTNFTVMMNYIHPGSNCCFASVAEESFKLNVKVRNFPKKFSSPYNIGDHIEMFGRFQLESNYMFVVANFNDITKIDDQTMPRKLLSLANQQIPVSTSKHSNITKKRKIDDEPIPSGSGYQKNNKKLKENDEEDDEEDDDL